MPVFQLLPPIQLNEKIGNSYSRGFPGRLPEQSLTTTSHITSYDPGLRVSCKVDHVRAYVSPQTDNGSSARPFFVSGVP